MPISPLATSSKTRSFYSDPVSEFLAKPPNEILDVLASQSAQTGFPPLQSQLQAWQWQIQLLKGHLANREGTVYFEYSIPRMGRRIDVALLMGGVIFVLEFKIGEKFHTSQALDQVWDYALDLKNFHTTSHDKPIVPLLIPSEAGVSPFELTETYGDGVYRPIRTSPASLPMVLDTALTTITGPDIDPDVWDAGRYQPTPTIIEAARVLYNTHSVVNISRNEAEKENLNLTSNTIHEIIKSSREKSLKTICFVTGVPGAGKTLVGLKVATEFMDSKSQLHAV